MKISIENLLVVLVLFVGSGCYFFYKAANNVKGLIINHIFYLDVNQANTFYFVLGCVCIAILVLCTIVFLHQKPIEKN